MQTERIKLSRLKVNENNPRTISKDKFEKLVDSILVFPNMLSVRPIVVDEEYRALGGNMRTEALREIGKMSLDAILERLDSMRDYNDLPGFDKENLIGFWKAWLSDNVVDVVNVKGFSDEEKRQFIIKDNLGYGEWDWDMLSNEWDVDQLKDWGVDLPGDFSIDIDPNSCGEEFSLPDGDKEPFQQITFTLADAQAEVIKQAIVDVKLSEEYKYIETFGNGNSNGNALYLIVSQWAEQRK